MTNVSLTKEEANILLGYVKENLDGLIYEYGEEGIDNRDLIRVYKSLVSKLKRASR